MPPYARHDAAEETWSSDVLILLHRRTLDPWRRPYGHGRAFSLTTIFDVHHPTLRDVACRANKRMVLNSADKDGLVRDHVR